MPLRKEVLVQIERLKSLCNADPINSPEYRRQINELMFSKDSLESIEVVEPFKTEEKVITTPKEVKNKPTQKKVETNLKKLEELLDSSSKSTIIYLLKSKPGADIKEINKFSKSKEFLIKYALKNLSVLDFN